MNLVTFLKWAAAPELARLDIGVVLVTESADGLSAGLLQNPNVAQVRIDLPDANVAIQVSGTFGSRQEEAQRLGRILRPKADGGLAYFYSIVTRDTRDQEFSANRQLFLTEQGYRYVIEDAEPLLASAPI